MFQSFFPNPRVFLISIVVWSAVCIGVWYGWGTQLGSLIGFDFASEAQQPVLGLGHFVTSEFMWFYLYYFVSVGMFGWA